MQKLSAKTRSPLSQSRAYKAELEMSKTSNKVLVVKLPDPVVSAETVKAWSTGIESALFPKPVGPRSFLLVLKDEVDMKKEIEKLKKVTFGAGKLTVEEKKITDLGRKVTEGHNPSDFIDPYTLYLTNLDESVTREDVQKLFPAAKTVMSPKKHNPKAGTPSKFAFVGFETAEAALEGFQLSYNKKFINGKFILVRFRRLSKGEVMSAKNATAQTEKKAGEATPSAAATKRKAEEVKAPVKKEEPKKAKQIKVEPQAEDDDEDDEDDEDMDDDELVSNFIQPCDILRTIQYMYNF